MRLRPFAPLGLLVLTGYLACTPAPTLEQPAPAAPRLTHAPRAAQNGLTSNGLFQNGLFQNGLFQNGLFQNGLFQNGLFQNSLALEALWQRQTWEANPAALAVLRDNVYARDALKYVYECAKTPAQSKVIAFEGVTLELHGLIGLAPEPAQPGDECDEICQQRWVTACVLARTNAYGLPVDISMRAPDDAPATVKAALNVTDNERAAYPLREGAFYGNLFRQAPRPGDGAVVMAPKFYGCAGPGSNIPQVTKRFCSSQGAGGPIRVPGTCEPRPEFPQSACQGVSGDATTGAMHDCYERVDPNARGEHYPEVITVYLKQPIEVCGNSVCETNEEIATNGPATTSARGAKGRPTAASAAGDVFAAGVACPSDCHPGGWASSLAVSLGESLAPGEVQSQIGTPYWVRTAALGPGDSIVVAGIAPATVDLGGGPPTAGPDGKQYRVFPIGTTTVTCAAVDPLGNTSTTALDPAGTPQPVAFTVTVVDQLGPAFLNVPAPITVTPSPGSTSAVVTFPLPLALDQIDGSREVTCVPASGSVFSVGTREVTCSAADAQGHLTEVSFDVTVADVVPPSITHVPAPFTVEASEVGGARPTFERPLAFDLVDENVPVTCSPASGALFPPGATTVTCSATDASGNTATRSFPVTVAFAWSGLLKPLDSNGQAFPIGTKLKVRFRLTAASAGILDLPATLSAVEANPKPLGALAKTPSPEALTGAMPFRYDPSKGWYEYELATKSMAPGEWELHVHLGDGVPRSVPIRLWR